MFVLAYNRIKDILHHTKYSLSGQLFVVGGVLREWVRTTARMSSLRDVSGVRTLRCSTTEEYAHTMHRLFTQLCAESEFRKYSVCAMIRNTLYI